MKKFIFFWKELLTSFWFVPVLIIGFSIVLSIKDTENYNFIPSISILVAILAAIVNIILLIIFIHQMVEIAARALSPGVNDPFTAIACIDNVTGTLCYLAQAKFPSKYRVDEDARLRVIADVLDFEGVLDAAFNQIRQFSGGSTAVIIRLMEALKTILNMVRKESHKKAVIKHAEMVFRQGKETIKEENDLQDLTERADKILKK